MNMKEYIEEAESALLHTYNRYQIVWDRGDGVKRYMILTFVFHTQTCIRLRRTKKEKWNTFPYDLNHYLMTEGLT